MYRARFFLSFMLICMISVLFILGPQLGWCDGIIVESSGDVISEPGQKAMIVWDKDLKKETLILNASFGIESLSNFCWVIPIQSSEDPNVRASDAEVFDELEDLFPVSTRWDWYGGYQYYNAFSPAVSSVDVIHIYKIGVYDLAVVWANDPEDFTDWLSASGYDVPAGFAKQIKAYTSAPEGSYFVANKVDLENEFASPLDRLEIYSPGIYADLMADDLDTSTINDVIDELASAITLDIKDGDDYDPNSFTAYIMDEDEYEYLQDKWSDGAITSYNLRSKVKTYITSSSLFETIQNLFKGAGTPIEITFYPDEPTYPLYISALASNWGGIDVYFIGPYTVDDENSILSYWKSIGLSSSTRSELEDLADIEIPDSCHYVSLLIYRGYMDALDDDAVFVRYTEPQPVSPISPYYYPPYRPPIYYPPSYPSYYPPSYPSYYPTSPIIINIYPFGGYFGGGYGSGGGGFGGGYGSGYGSGGGGFGGGFGGGGSYGGGYYGGWYPSYGGGYSYGGFSPYGPGYSYGYDYPYSYGYPGYRQW